MLVERCKRLMVYKTDYRIRLALVILSLVFEASGVVVADSLPQCSPASQGVSSAGKPIGDGVQLQLQQLISESSGGREK